MASSVFLPIVDLSNVTGTLPVANGGTSLATLTAHALYVGNGTGAPAAVSVGATGTVLVGATGADPAFSGTLPNALVAAKGTGAATGPLSAALTVNTTLAATGADTNETTLWTYNLPANTLSANGKGVRITVFGSFAANNNTKTLRTKFGGTTVHSEAGGGAFNANGFVVTCYVYRTGAGAQLGIGHMTFGGGAQTDAPVTPAETETNAIAIAFTGENGTAAANDIVFRGALVEALN